MVLGDSAFSSCVGALGLRYSIIVRSCTRSIPEHMAMHVDGLLERRVVALEAISVLKYERGIRTVDDGAFFRRAGNRVPDGPEAFPMPARCNSRR